MEKSFETSYIGSPSKLEKRDNIRLAYECIQHKANSYKSPQDKWAYASKVEDLMLRLLRFTRSELKQKIEAHYKEMEDKILEIDKADIEPDKKEREKLDIRFKYAHSIHQHNIKLLPQTGIIIQDVEGELDITNEEVLDVIRGGKRRDDTNLQFRR